MVARAHAAEVEQAADAVERAARPRTCVAGMRINCVTAVELPELIALCNDRFAGMPNRGKTHLCLDMLVMRPEVVGRVPWLNDRIEIECRQRGGRSRQRRMSRSSRRLEVGAKSRY